MTRRGPKRELITASAGSGKTFQLTNRYIELLLLGEKPESIVALTFSRKAAGEFFDAILNKLASASCDPEKLNELNDCLGLSVPAASYREKLAELLGVMRKLTMGTLDSFFYSILSRFPLEHGLSGNLSMLNPGELDLEVGRVLTHLYGNADRGSTVGERLGVAFRKACLGSDDRRFSEWLAELAIYYRALRSLCDDAGRWGRAELIWNKGAPWMELPKDYTPTSDLLAARKTIAGNEFSDPPFSDDNLLKLEQALRLLENWSPKVASGYISQMFRRLMHALASWNPGEDVVLKVGVKEFAIGDELCLPLSRVFRFLLRNEFERRMQRTQGVFEILSLTESTYDALVRSRGALTFADVPLLLGSQDDPLAGMEMEFRLDGQFRHWLLDEFQDTSPAQWRVLENLIEEVIHDSDDARAFFCVGDVKQAIYGWRGGDSRLFELLRKNYADRLDESSLNESWRSGPDVLDAVNGVFGNLPSAEIVCSRWSEAWRNHEPSSATKGQKGHVAWWVGDDVEERKKALAALLRDVDPVNRGLTCAILTQKRNTAREVVDFLRSTMPDLPVENEVGANPGADNPFSTALLSLFKAAAFPRDSFSRGHLKMTPLGSLLAPSGGEEELNDALVRVLRQLHDEGFSGVARHWGSLALEQVDQENRSFAADRLRHFEEIAERFDLSGSRDVNAFVEFAKNSESSGGSSEKSIRVMTIHKSKGLTFDLVVLPELDGSSLFSLRRGPKDLGIQLYVRSNSLSGEVDWTLDWPSSLYAEADETLAGVIHEERGEACFENLCKLYVAMTRPRQGLYLFTAAPKKKSTSVNYLHLLNGTLGEPSVEMLEEVKEHFPSVDPKISLRHSSGVPAWFLEREPEKSGQDQVNQALFEDHDCPKSRFPRLPSLRPSGHHHASRKGETLFARRQDHAMQVGSEVHEIFQKIEWLEDKSAASEFFKDLPSETSDQAIFHVRRVLSTNETLQAFVLPGHNAEVWREKSFSIRQDGNLINGSFDRVVLLRDSKGDYSRAEIIDFKTDHDVRNQDELEHASQRHASQLEHYRVALACLTGIPRESISIFLLFTAVPTLRKLSA